MLTRLKLTAIRDQLDNLLDEVARRELTFREALTWRCQAEIARKEERRLQMAMSIAKFPFVRTLEGFDFETQPSLDPKQVRELALCRWVAHGDVVLLLGPPGVGKSPLAVALGREAFSVATPSCSPPPRRWWPCWPKAIWKDGWRSALATLPNPSY
jgi:DNA replication protein DnaC